MYAAECKVTKIFLGRSSHDCLLLINRCPSSDIEFKTPIEIWSGQPADYANLRVLGCMAYAHIRQDKLAARALKCIFIGYPDGVKGYKVWNQLVQDASIQGMSPLTNLK